MKHLSFIPLFLLVTINIVNAQQKTYVPDDKFEQHLINQGWDDVLDDSVLTASISGRSFLDVSYKDIEDLTGIEDFVSLQILHCENNSIPSMDIGGATVLRQLYCSGNQLTELNVTNNLALTYLDCYDNDISSLDVSNNTALETLSCSNNSLETLDVSQNTALTMLQCANNSLETLDVDGANLLNYISCERNNLYMLELTQNPALKTINCTYNQLQIINVQNGHNEVITTFNASYNPLLTCIGVDDPVKANNGESPYNYWVKPATATYSDGCTLPQTYVPDDNFERVLGELGYDDIPGDNSVTTYYISMLESLVIDLEGIEDMTGIEDFTSLKQLDCSYNQIVDLDLSKNTMLTELDCSNNQLTGLNMRSGANYLLTSFNATGNPSLQCIEVDNEIKAVQGLAPYTNWLKDETAGYSANCSLFGVTTYVPDDNFEQTLINLGYDFGARDDYVSTSVISTVTSLNVASKYIQDLTGIEGFTGLESLSCYNNLLQDLDISQNSNLKSLSCYTNQLTELDLTGNAGLHNLNITNNLFEGSFDLTGCPELTGFDCQNNQISELILTGNPKLVSLSCRKNLIANLNLANNNALITVDCSDNNLNSLVVTGKPDLTVLDCGLNNISEMVLGDLDLRNLKCDYNQLESLSLGEFTDLSRLDCNDNKLTTLELGSKSDLWLLDCSNNLLESLDLTGATGLIDFVCSNNLLKSLDLSNSPTLGGLYCSNNKIGNLNLTGNPNLLTLYCHHNSLTSLYLVNNNKLKYVWANDNVLLIGFDGPTIKGEKSGEAVLANNNLKSINLRNTGLASINLLDYAILDSLNMEGTQLSSLDVSGNPLLRYLNTTGTPLGCIQVSEAQLASIPPGWVKDPTTIYSLDCQAVSIDDNSILAESIRLYPNPVKDILTVESDIPIINVEIYSITGNRVKDIFSGFTAIPINDLAEGTYIIKVEFARGIVSRKITVRH